MKQLDEFAFTKFVRGLNNDDRAFLIKEYQIIADKLRPLTRGRPKKE